MVFVFSFSLFVCFLSVCLNLKAVEIDIIHTHTADAECTHYNLQLHTAFMISIIII